MGGGGGTGLAWVPDTPPCPPPGYQIAYRLASSSPNTFTTVEVGATVRQFTATELAPESAYLFRLSAKTRQGWGQPLEATVITTEKRGEAWGPRPQAGRGGRPPLQTRWAGTGLPPWGPRGLHIGGGGGAAGTQVLGGSPEPSRGPGPAHTSCSPCSRTARLAPVTDPDAAQGVCATGLVRHSVSRRHVGDRGARALPGEGNTD